jgi:hypothetical protein
MGISRCTVCSAVRPPNTRFCQQCGTPFDIRDLPLPPETRSFPTTKQVDMSIWTGVKLGIGITLGSMLVGLVALLLFALAIRLRLPF